jgi:hypothetical protein
MEWEANPGERIALMGLGLVFRFKVPYFKKLLKICFI